MGLGRGWCGGNLERKIRRILALGIGFKNGGFPISRLSYTYDNEERDVFKTSMTTGEGEHLRETKEKTTE